MKTLATALVALAILAGIAAPITGASAFDPRTFYEEQQNNLP